MAKRPFKKRSPRRGVLPSLTPRDDFRSEYLSRRVNALSAPRKVEGIRRSLEKFRLYGALRETSTRTCDHVPTREGGCDRRTIGGREGGREVGVTECGKCTYTCIPIIQTDVCR